MWSVKGSGSDGISRGNCNVVVDNGATLSATRLTLVKSKSENYIEIFSFVALYFDDFDTWIIMYANVRQH